jgi:hypothetical protein
MLGFKIFETASEAFLRSLHSLKLLYTLKLKDLLLNSDQYMTILSTPSIQRLALRRVYLCGKPPEGPARSQITDLELTWDLNMISITNQLFQDLENDLEQYTLRMRTPGRAPLNPILPRSPQLKSLTMICSGLDRGQVFLSSLHTYIGGAASLPLNRPPHIFPRVLRVHLRSLELCLGHWIAGNRLDLLDITQAAIGFATFEQIAVAMESSASISELRLRVIWNLSYGALHRLATRPLPVTKLIIQIDRKPRVSSIIPSLIEEPWIGVEKIEIIVAWTPWWVDLDDMKSFRRWVEERVEDQRSRIRHASFDIWRSPGSVWRAFDSGKDEVQWWERWDSLSRCWECPGDRDLTCLR